VAEGHHVPILKRLKTPLFSLFITKISGASLKQTNSGAVVVVIELTNIIGSIISKIKKTKILCKNLQDTR
jgi:hypothetical protein